MKHASGLQIRADDGSDMLREITVDVDRISQKLAKLTNPDFSADLEINGEAVPDQSETTITESDIRAAIRARRARYRYFSAMLFADPAWDILLHLFQAELGQRRISVSDACTAAQVPATTGLRWLKTLTDQELIIRRSDPLDARRAFLELSRASSSAMHRYFREIATKR